MNYTEELFKLDPFDFSKEAKDIFRKSLVENIKHHKSNNEFINHFYKNFNENKILSEEDIVDIPHMMINLFKENEFCSAKKEEIVLTLSSSGTSGQKSLQLLNQESLDNVKLLAKNVYSSLGITSSKKYNYLCFTYDPKVANDLGTAFTDELLTSFTNIREVYYAIEFCPKTNDFKLNEKKVLEKLKEFEKSEYSTRILGFPSFLYEIMTKNDLKLNLGKDSWVQIGGGWKNYTGELIDKYTFRELINSHLGIPKENVRDLFGMVEHGIPYVDSKKGHLMIPNYARVIIRDPFTLRPLDYGETGLIQFICSYNTSYPAFSLLSSDWGKKELIDNKESLVITGRAGIKKSKGCAISANELLKGI